MKRRNSRKIHTTFSQLKNIPVPSTLVKVGGPPASSPCCICCAPDRAQILHRVTPGCRPPGRSHREQPLGKCFSKLFKPSWKTGVLRDLGKFFHPCLEHQDSSTQPCCSMEPLARTGFLDRDTVPVSPSQRLSLQFGRHSTTRGTTAHDPHLQVPAAEPPPGQESWRERIWAGGRTGRLAALCKPAFHALPLSQNLLLVLLCQDAVTFLPAPALPALLDRHRQLHSHARAGFPALCFPLLCKNQLQMTASPGRSSGSSRRASYQRSGRQRDPFLRPCPIPGDNTHVLAEPRTQAVTSAAVLALTELQNELRRLQLGLP